MKQKQKLKFNDFLIIILGIAFFVSASAVWGQKIFWNKKNQILEKSISAKTKVIKELKIKNKTPKTATIREILTRANSERIKLAPIISGMWKLETPTVKFKDFSMNDNKITVSAITVNAETIAQFLEMLKRTPDITNSLVTDFVTTTDGTQFHFVFDRINK